MENENAYLYKRAVESDTETPRECQILAMVYVSKGEPIPQDVYKAVMTLAERRKDILKTTLDEIDKTFKDGIGDKLAQLNLTVLAGSIALSHGIDSPNAAKRRLDSLIKYFKGHLLTEEMGPTE